MSDVEHVETAIADIKLDARRVEDKVSRLAAGRDALHCEMIRKFDVFRNVVMRWV